ncbi:DoxX family protein [Lutimonas sp.]|uniref:DoxX family protein n=1 Tax=Lutimonas sp. TaxID=1872403 RepID=UPI003D9B7673
MSTLAVTICILISSLSFFAYAFSYFYEPHMKNEFKRFGLEKIGLTTILLEITGAFGLLVGFKFPLILMISSLGLTLLMFAGVIVRIKIKDSLRVSLPAIFFMFLNAYIFLDSISLIH